MKKTIKLTMLCLSIFFSANSYMQASTLENLEKTPLKEVLNQFEKRFNVFFSYEKSTVKNIEVSFEFLANEKSDEAITRLLNTVNLDFETFGNKYIVIYQKNKKSSRSVEKLKKHFLEIEKIESESDIQVLSKHQKFKLKRQENVISGTVKDTFGEPLLGATVLVEGTNNGVTTDFDGKFSVSVKSFPVNLIVRYVGYTTQTITVSSTDELNITLQENVNEIDEIFVTARKREETLKDVPIAITAVSGVKLDALGAQDITATAALSPNVNFSYGGTSSGSSSAAVVYIRGVGQNDFVPTVDPGVGIYLDGVYLGRSVGAVLSLADVQRVEVLRGPQGTLFGRNTIGGAISLTSNEPADEFSGNLKITGGTFNRFDSSAIFNIPFSDKVKSSVSLLQRRRNGYVERLVAGDDLGDENLLGVKTTVLYKPSDNFKIKASFDYSSEDESSAAEEQLSSAGVFTDNILGGIEDQVSTIPFTTNETGPSLNNTDAFGISLVADLDLNDNLSLKSISAYRDLRAGFARSTDGTPIDVFGTIDVFTQDQFSQELQLIGGYDKVDFVAGAYYFQENAFNAVVASADATGIPVFPFDIGGTTDNQSLAVFGELTLHVGENFHLTGGLRFTDETKAYDPFAINALGGLNVTPGFRELDFSELTWRGIAAYDISESVNAYVSASKGFKSGGFDVRFTNPTEDLEPTSFLPETVNSFEGGLKTYFKEAGLRFNLALFYSDYENIQVSINPPGGIATRTVNGAEARLFGAELEFDWSPAKNLIIDGSLGLIEAEYTSLAEGSELSLEDEFIRTPTSTYTIGVSYLAELGNNRTLTPRINLNAANDIHFEPVNNEFVFEDGYANINISALYKTGNGKLEFTGGINNLTDERYLLAGDSNGTIGYALGIFQLPRNWYASARFNF